MSSNELVLTSYVKRGRMLVLRAALPIEDPESWPNKWIEKFGTIQGFDWEGCFGKEYAEEVEETFYQARYGRDRAAEIGRSGKCPHCGEYL